MERSDYDKALNAKHVRAYYWKNREVILAARKAAREADHEPRKVGRPRTRADPPENLRRGRPKKIQVQENLQADS